MTTFEYLTYLKVHRGLDCFGMSKDELSKMVQVGYDKWAEGYEQPMPIPTANAKGATIRCAQGSKCFNATARKAAFGTGRYCSAVCKGAAHAQKRSEKAAWQANNAGMVGIAVNSDLTPLGAA